MGSPRTPCRTSLRPAALLAAIALLSGGCHHAAAPTASGPSAGSAQDQQAAMQGEAYQISHSNLPPDQKQRLLNQMHAAGAK